MSFTKNLRAAPKILRSTLSALVFVLGLTVAGSLATIFSSNTAAAATTQAACEALGDTWYPATGTSGHYTASCDGKATCASGGGIWDAGEKTCSYISGGSNLSAKMQGMSVDDRAKSYAYYKAVYRCVDKYLKTDSIYASIDYDGLKTQPTNGFWYGDSKEKPDQHWSGLSGPIAEVAFMGNPDASCSQVTSDALTFWNIGTPADMLKALGYTYDAKNSSPQWKYSGNKSKAASFKSWVEGKGVATGLTSETQYSLAKTAFGKLCQPKLLGAFDSLSSGRQGQINSYNRTSGKLPAQTKLTDISGSSLVTNGYEYQFGPDNSSFRLDSMFPIYEDGDASADSTAWQRCVDMPNTINSNAASFLNSMLENSCRALGVTVGDALKACKAGLQFSSNADFCTMVFSDAGQQNACKKGQGGTVEDIPTAADTADSGNGDTKSSCVVEGVGWIVCPITNFLAGVSDASYGLIKNFLQVNTKIYDTESGTYVAWSSFRNIANVAFVIAFLFIIFSQLTGQGVSNYGIKKMLPRLVVAAILVNLSYFVCQLAVDFSQILGVSIHDILKNIPISNGNPPSSTAWTDTLGDILMGSVIGLAAVGAAVAAVAVIGLSISLPVLLVSLLAVLMTVIILIGRQAAIVILIVLSPLAFVAYILPNTESWFKKWYKVFFGLLMVFPVVSLLYGGGELASKIISSASVGADASTKFWFSITALGVAALPLVFTPTLLKGALNATGSIGTKLSGLASKANGGVRRTANTSSRFGEAKQGLKNRFALGRANRRTNSKVQNAIDNSSIGRSLGLDKGARRAFNTIDKESAEDIDSVIAQFSHDKSVTPSNRLEVAQARLEAAVKSGDTTSARAYQKVLLSSGGQGLKKLQSAYSKDDVVQGLHNHSSSTNALQSDLVSAGLKGKNSAIDIWSTSGSGRLGDLSKIATEGSTLSRLNPVELAGQSVENLRAGTITPSMAQATLGNAEASALLDGEKRALLTSIANKSASSTSAAAQRAYDAVAKAAEGIPSSGGTFAVGGDKETVFTVEHRGDNTSSTPPQAPAAPQTPPTPPAQGQNTQPPQPPTQPPAV